jgi:hypothetical protein
MKTKNLSGHIPKLKPKQVKKLQSVLMDAAIAYYNGLDFRELFRREKHQHIGRMKEFFEFFETASDLDLDEVTKDLLGVD